MSPKHPNLRFSTRITIFESITLTSVDYPMRLHLSLFENSTLNLEKLLIVELYSKANDCYGFNSEYYRKALNDHFSRYGELQRCEIKERLPGVSTGFVVGKRRFRVLVVALDVSFHVFDKQQALKSGPHTIEGAVVDINRAMDDQPHVIDGSYSRSVSLFVGSLPENVTEETLRNEFSKYGKPVFWKLQNDGQFNQSRTYGLVSYGTVHSTFDFSMKKKKITDQCVAQIIQRAMDDRPHIIGGKPLKIKFLGKGHKTPVSLFVGSLPENVTEETLRNEFSKYGKPIFWELENDGGLNQSGPYGIVSYSSEQEALNVLNSGPHTIEGSVVNIMICFYLEVGFGTYSSRPIDKHLTCPNPWAELLTGILKAS
ncbi:RNA recognition motif domain-containing protein [Ditylenchus destructor]|nr:RNA recognition motif domain-containing protein [Ditylenchus destructor]